MRTEPWGRPPPKFLYDSLSGEKREIIQPTKSSIWKLTDISIKDHRRLGHLGLHSQSKQNKTTVKVLHKVFFVLFVLRQGLLLFVLKQDLPT